jgi:hypothetical protein
MIQPMMYFNLRHIPMFSGSYMILGVNHNIQPGSFTTQFEGVRQSIFSLPNVDSYIQAALTSLVTSVFNENKQAASLPQSNSANTDQQKQKSNSNTTDAEPLESDSCTANTKFTQAKFESITKPTLVEYSYQDMVEEITGKTSTLGIDSNIITKINYVVWSIIWNYTNTSSVFRAYGNNFGGVRLDIKINNQQKDFGNGPRHDKLSKSFACLSIPSQDLQYASAVFDSLENFLDFTINYIKPLVDSNILSKQSIKDEKGKIVKIDDLTKDIDRFIITNWPIKDDTIDYEKNIFPTQEAKTRITNYKSAIGVAESLGL